MALSAGTDPVAAQSAPVFNADRIMMLGLGFWGAKTLLSAVEMGVFTTLAKKALDGPTLSKEIGLHPRSSRDFLDALVALGMLDRNGETYSNAPDVDFLLDRAKPSYIGGLLEMANARLYPYWGALTQGLKTGLPQNEIKSGKSNVFEEFYSDPARMCGFLQAMTGLSMGAAKQLAQKFPWEEYKTFADIGGAQGGAAVQIALAHPHLRGIVFDLPVVQPVLEDYVKSFHLENRVCFAPGNFFADPLPAADVILMGHILHDWDLEQKKALISKAYAALPKNGALVVFEAIIDDERKWNVFGLLMSLNMLIETPGGFDYTGADCCTWMREAGFSETSVEYLAGPDSMVIGIKK